MSNYSAGGSKGPARPLGGVRGKEAWGTSRNRLSPSPRRRRRRKRKETWIVTNMISIERKKLSVQYWLPEKLTPAAQNFVQVARETALITGKSD